MTLPKSVFVVVGSTGEYSDHMEWNIAAYITKEEAEQHRDLANEFAKGKEKLDWREQEKLKNPYDPDMKIDYTGTRYYVNEVKLFVHVDEFLAQEPNVS
jgi:hypothetical protein